MPESSEPRPLSNGYRKAAWTLVVLAPVCAELTFLGVALPVTWLLLPLFILMYGAGVLVIRELVCRVGGGWPSLLLMGVVYELVEDGIGLQALSSPNLYNAADWGPRVFGLNMTYWEAQIGYHVVFSVLIPIMLTDLLFPRHRGIPYLRRGGLIGFGIAAIVGVAGLRVVIAGTEDPGYQAPLPVLAGIVVASVVLAVVALRVLPGRTASSNVVGDAPRPGGVGVAPRRAPRPGGVGLVAALATFGFLALLMPPGSPPERPAIGSGLWVLIPMALAAVIAGTACWLIRRWSAAGDWTDRHRIWLAGGALVSHTLFPIAYAPLGNDTSGPVITAFAIGIPIVVLTPILLGLLARRLAAVNSSPVDSGPVGSDPVVGE